MSAAGSIFWIGNPPGNDGPDGKIGNLPDAVGIGMPRFETPAAAVGCNGTGPLATTGGKRHPYPNLHEEIPE
jgi:hypothetical protein